MVSTAQVLLSQAHSSYQVCFSRLEKGAFNQVLRREHDALVWNDANHVRPVALPEAQHATRPQYDREHAPHRGARGTRLALHAFDLSTATRVAKDMACCETLP